MGKINAIEIKSIRPSKDTVLCIHGLCCDARIFSYVGRKLAEAGYNVVSIDLPGHGKSDGEKGDLDFDDSLQSIKQIILELKKNSRVFVLAHSMGCTFALWFARAFGSSINGLILMSPYLRVRGVKKRSDAEPSLFSFLYLLFRRMITPHKKVNITKVLGKYAEIGGDEVLQMMKDPALNFEYSYRYLIDIVAARNNKVSELSKINVPILILHGKKDRNVFPEVSETFFKMLSTSEKRIKSLDCDHWFYDSIFYNQESVKYSEESRLKVISSINDWIRSVVHIEIDNIA